MREATSSQSTGKLNHLNQPLCYAAIIYCIWGLCAVFLLAHILLLIMRGVEVCTKIVVLITWVAKPNLKTQVSLAITDIKAK